jgi:hypothetical protein
MSGKRNELTLRDLGLTSYFQEVSRGYSKLGNELEKKTRGLTTDEGLNVRIGKT